MPHTDATVVRKLADAGAIVMGKLATHEFALGGPSFFRARLVYALVYLVGIPWARTAIWLVSVIGLL